MAHIRKSVHEWPFELGRSNGCGVYPVRRRSTRPWGRSKELLWVRIVRPDAPFAGRPGIPGWKLYVEAQTGSVLWHGPVVWTRTKHELLDRLGQMDKQGGGLYATTLVKLPVLTAPSGG